MSSSGKQTVQPLRDLRVAVGFLTRVPVGDVAGGDPSSVRLASAVPWFPFVAAGIGLAQAGAWRGLVEVVSPTLAAAISTAVGLLITGAFHHDGLADMADAFGGGWTVEQRFEILKDSRLGTYGTTALIVALLIEVAAVSSFEAAAGFGAITCAHVLGRVVAIGAMVVAPIAGDGLGASYMSDLSKIAVTCGAVAGIVIATVASPVLIIWPLLAAMIAAAIVVGLAVRKIGGVTGDVLGAVTVCATVAALATTAAVV